MPRRRRQHLFGPAGYYYVMNRWHIREVVFRTHEDCAFFLQLWPRYCERFDLRLYHYCLMSNHFHALVRCPQPGALSAGLAGLLRSYVHYFNRRYGFVGHLWQGERQQITYRSERRAIRPTWTPSLHVGLTPRRSPGYLFFCGSPKVGSTGLFCNSPDCQPANMTGLPVYRSWRRTRIQLRKQKAARQLWRQSSAPTSSEFGAELCIDGKPRQHQKGFLTWHQSLRRG